jgi:hypothetical protein
MKALLICPEYRPAGGLFQRMKPLALMPLMGRSLLDRALAELKREGVEEVVVLAADRPEMVRKAAGHGKAWGLKVEVRAVRTELDPDVAEMEHGRRHAGEARPLVRVLDAMPGLELGGLWKDHQSTFDLLANAAQDPNLAAQVTMQEQSPGVWISSKAHVSQQARIVGPAWIGPHASVRSGAQVGPGAMIESGAFIDSDATVVKSWVGPDTYLGKDLTLRDSLAWGQGLLSLRRDSFMEVRDAFLMTDLAGHLQRSSRAPLIERVMALMLMFVTLPRAAWLLVGHVLKGDGCFNERRVVLGPATRVDAYSRTRPLLNLRGAGGLFQRWPELWDVVCGRLALIGNRPLTAQECGSLRGALGEMWLKHASGVFSLADTRGAEVADQSSLARAHAAFFSGQRSLALRWTIFRRCLPAFLFPKPPVGDSKQAISDNQPANPQSIQALS